MLKMWHYHSFETFVTNPPQPLVCWKYLIIAASIYCKYNWLNWPLAVLWLRFKIMKVIHKWQYIDWLQQTPLQVWNAGSDGSEISIILYRWLLVLRMITNCSNLNLFRWNKIFGRAVRVLIKFHMYIMHLSKCVSHCYFLSFSWISQLSLATGHVSISCKPRAMWHIRDFSNPATASMADYANSS